MMKKLFAVTFVFIAFMALWAAETDYQEAGDYDGVPKNVKVCVLGDKATTDSIYADSSVIYGPFSITAAVGQPSAKGFQVYFPLSGMDSGDSIQVGYQMGYSGNQNDTLTTWTLTDTVVAGDVSTYTDISSKAAASLFIRLYNVDASVTPLLANKKPRLVFITAAQEEY